MLWYDGRLVEGPVVFDLADRGLLLGDGLFDTALAIGGRIVFEDAHLERLCGSAQALGFAAPRERIRTAMRAVAGAHPRTAIRTSLTRGPGPRGLAPPADPTPLLFARAAPARADLAFAPTRLHVTDIARNETSPIARHKTLGYLDAVLAAREAVQAGFDEALFLNTRGHVACAGIANIFAVCGSELVTPPLADGVLSGIVRGEILRVASSLGLRAAERSLSLDALLRAECVFLTNSLRLMSPVIAIGTTHFDSAAHPAFAALAGHLEAACRDR